ncbi:MAG: amidohydrolase, partial [Planctomycetota bacterium]|nr:amidohydrolase [Planctomycetota bacterium]
MRVALVEHETIWEDPAANRKKIAASLPQADLVLLPEQCFSGFSMAAEADAEAEPFLARMA